jgi:hypothetical protein
MEPHKGTELNNVRETWQQNEQAGEPARNTDNDKPTTVSNDLQQTIKEEAAAYDNANKEDRILDGDRATVNEDKGGDR